jgi:hypothetical protein
MKGARADAVRRLKDKHESVVRGQRARKTEALSVYELSVDRAGFDERRQHYTALLRWYRNTNEADRVSYNRCANSVANGDAAAAVWASNVAFLLSRPGETWTPDAIHGQGAQSTYQRYYESWRCHDDIPFESAPSRPSLGQGLGPFRLVAQWLLGPESLSLALIVGMIGFGLLGSAISTFVRESHDHKRAPGEPLVGDLAGVVLRGVSAAIVVFLAVEGGLNVFSGSASEPNPYVLLFTCIVGAVFSERVWEWAREKIIPPAKKDLDNAGAGDSPAPAGPKQGASGGTITTPAAS